MTPTCSKTWGPLALAIVLLAGLAFPVYANEGPHPKLDKVLNSRAGKPGTSRIIVTVKPGWDVSADAAGLGAKVGRRLRVVQGQVLELSNGELRKLADHPGVARLHWDRPTGGTLNRLAVTVGARGVQRGIANRGAGIGVAVIDSGITGWHDDLTYSGSAPIVRTVNGQRVVGFVDFINGRTTPYDDNGHGTHVSGIIAGNGHDSRGAYAGIAPDAHLLSLKVLDRNARGRISNVIAAIEYAIANRAAYNIRVINVSVGAAVTESYLTDPLTVATKRAVDAGIVVVAAAGNLGVNASGHPQYGGITAPANAPWVLTVGASSHEGTVTRVDDVVASYSSRGPTAIDYTAKPDLMAPGTGIVSLSDATSLLYTTKADYLLKGSIATSYKPYLSLSGTSMAAPVVAGTVALMLEANPALTPNLVKGILQYTAQKYDYNPLTQGAGFLNTRGAVQLASFFANARPGDVYPVSAHWSRQLIWGNHRLTGGVIKPNATAWAPNVVWGSAVNRNGENIVWGSLCRTADCENIVWGTFDENIVWGTLDENIVWGSTFFGNGENIVWGTWRGADENIVWGTFRRDNDENIVWGTLGFDENIVWGTDCGGRDCENVVWGSFDPGENIVWGTFDEYENLVWGSLDENIVWGTLFPFDENIVWGSNGDVENLVWGSSSEPDNVTWGNAAGYIPLFDDPNAEPVALEDVEWEQLFSGPQANPVPAVESTLAPETAVTPDGADVFEPEPVDAPPVEDATPVDQPNPALDVAAPADVQAQEELTPVLEPLPTVVVQPSAELAPVLEEPVNVQAVEEPTVVLDDSTEAQAIDGVTPTLEDLQAVDEPTAAVEERVPADVQTVEDVAPAFEQLADVDVLLESEAVPVVEETALYEPPPLETAPTPTPTTSTTTVVKGGI